MQRKRIGDILLEMGKVTKEQLDAARKEKEQTGEFTSQILIRNEIIKPSDVAEALATQLGVPYVDKITDKMAAPELLGKIPLKFLRQHVVMPILFEGKRVILTANPSDLQPIDELSFLIKETAGCAVATSEAIVDAINKYYPLEASKDVLEELEEESGELSLDDIEGKDLLEMANEAPIVKLVNTILYQSVKEDASDIHIEPFEKELRVRFRIDGVLYQKFLPPKRYQGAIVSRIKIMSNLNIAEKRLPQDGRIQIKIADTPVDIRVSILPSNFGERVVMRILDTSKGILDLESLNMSERDFSILDKSIHRPNGIVLVTGPTGSGKTSTLYAILAKLNTPDTNIITVEDPVEYTMSGISQVQVKDKIGLTFAAALRSILRQDPDIVLIGEIRDAETAQIATQAALTGHLVFSTLHTNDAPTSITRLIDMGVEPFLIASTVSAAMAQRLIRKLCDKCKKQHKPSEQSLERLGLTGQEASAITFYEPGGCEECGDTGYRGRIALFEVMEITDEVRSLIVNRANAAEISKAATKDGFTTLVKDGIRQIQAGTTTVDEVLSVAFAGEDEMTPQEIIQEKES